MQIAVSSDAVRAQLDEARAARHEVRVARDILDAGAIYGVPLDVSAELVLLATVKDWGIDGYALLRIGDVSEVRSDETERFSERVLAAEGELVRLVPPSPSVPVSSWAAAFEALRASGRFALVHEEQYEGEPMCVGPIVGLTDTGVLVHYVDTVGVWDPEPSEICIADITLVQFDDRYSTVFGRNVMESRPVN
jgi:hypothetical protein